MNKFLVFFDMNVKASACLILFLSVNLLFTSCKKEEETENKVRFNLQVVDDMGAIIYGDKVYIFSSQSAFENAISSNNFSSAVDSAVTVAAGGATFILKGNTEYWIFTKHFDSGRNVFLTNSGNGKIEKLEKNSELNVKLFISPSTGNITFWSRAANKFPINVTFGNTPYPALSSGLSSEPTGPGNTAAVNASKAPGTYTYKATSANGCVWAGTATVSRGSFQAIELTTCIRGRISFANPTYDPAHGPITVILDNNDPIGVLNASGSYACATSAGSAVGTGNGSFISTTRDINKYTYVATSQDNKCTWMGDFEIKSDTCIKIDLPPCGSTF